MVWGCSLGLLSPGLLLITIKTSPNTHNWQIIWLIPGGIAAVVSGFFSFSFLKIQNHMETQPGLDIEEPDAQVSNLTAVMPTNQKQKIGH